MTAKVEKMLKKELIELVQSLQSQMEIAQQQLSECKKENAEVHEKLDACEKNLACYKEGKIRFYAGKYYKETTREEVFDGDLVLFKYSSKPSKVKAGELYRVTFFNGKMLMALENRKVINLLDDRSLNTYTKGLRVYEECKM